MALGVQVKTGEDPPDGEIQISGYKKPSIQDEQIDEIKETHSVNSKLAKPTEQEQNKSERNKFNVEKQPTNSVPYQQFSGNRRRDRFYNRPTPRFYRRPPRFDDRRPNRRSPLRRPNRYNRSRSRDRHSRRKSKSVERKRSKSSERRQSRDEKDKEQQDKSETDAEKFKRRTEQLLLLKRKMELEMLEMHKKQEESQEKKVSLNS